MNQGSLTVGFYPLPPFIYILNNQLIGLLSRTYKNMYYFLFRPFNITYIAAHSTKLSSCNPKGKCNGLLGDLQSRLYDFGVFVDENELPEELDNITLGPLIGTTNCYTTSQPAIQSSLKIPNAFSSLTAFDADFWTLMFSAISSLVILLSFLKPRLSTSRWFEIFFEYSLGQRFRQIPKLSQKIVFLCFVFTSILCGAIFSASLQTGLTSILDFTRIDTLEDILDKNCKPFVLRDSACHRMVLLSANPLAKKLTNILSDIRIADFGIAQQVLIRLSEQNNILLGDDFTITRISATSCATDMQNNRETQQIYIANSPVLTEFSFLPVNSNLDRQITSKIFKHGLTAFETSNILNSKLFQQDSEDLIGQKLRLKCLTTLKPAKKVIITSINIEYSKSIFFIWLILLYLILFVFIAEFFSK